MGREAQNRILLSMPCCEKDVRHKLLEVVGNKEKKRMKISRQQKDQHVGVCEILFSEWCY